MQRYEKYKDSGVDWIGEIPEHWECTRLGALLTIFSSKNHADKPLLSITREKGVILRDLDDETENHNFIPDDLSGYKLIKKGQFGMNKMKAWQGSYGISDYDGIVSPAYFIFDIAWEIYPEFFHLAIRSKFYVAHFGSASDGVRIGQWDLSKPRMREIPFFIPPIEEQQTIATFLNDETAKIDQTIANKQKEIELLTERRQILIQKAVTKGLDETVPFKDSGVDWIGEIPEHWEVRKLRNCLRAVSIKNKAHMTLLSITREKGVIIRDKDNQEENHNFIPDDLSGYKMIKKGQFGMNKMKAWQGSYGISNYDGIVSPAYYIFNVTDKFTSEYFHLAIRSSVYVPFFVQASDGVRIGQWDLNKNRMNEIPFFIPSNKEQVEIVSYIKEVEEKIAKAILLKQQEIEKLKEYKTVLVDNVVTGKVRVS